MTKPRRPCLRCLFQSNGGRNRTPESPLRGMFQVPGPYVWIEISPLTWLCPDLDTNIRSDPIGVRMIAYTSIKTKNFSRSCCGNIFYSLCIYVAQEIEQMAIYCLSLLIATILMDCWLAPRSTSDFFPRQYPPMVKNLLNIGQTCCLWLDNNSSVQNHNFRDMFREWWISNVTVMSRDIRMRNIPLPDPPRMSG